MDKNTINTSTQNINSNIEQPYDAKGFFIYNPYSINSPIPTKEDLLQFLKVKELDINSEKKCKNVLNICKNMIQKILYYYILY